MKSILRRKPVRCLLSALLILCCVIFTACSGGGGGGNDPAEDPMANDKVVDISPNEAINNYLNQYNLDAENRVGNDDCFEATSTSIDVKIHDVVMRVSSIDGPITVLIEFSDPEDPDVPIISRDAIIALSPDISTDDIDSMLSGFLQDGTAYTNDYALGDLTCSFMQGDGGVYQLGVYQ
ncbi:MAG: hypothetical protein IJH77_00070 [Mogibacterium sp.]|nr:hypothetical protein [Mogibacterium sp.]